MMHLTYNRRNMIGDGCAEKTDSGLSDFGVEAVREMCRAGVIPDGAHSGQQTCVDAAKVASKPVVVSHSACRALHESIRGKDDATIKAVAESGGYIGICCIPDFLGGSRDLNALLDHIDYAAKKFGPDHVAIGTDHGYGSRMGDEEGKKIRNYPKFRAIWDQFWPPNCFTHSDPNSRENLSLSWLNWKYFTVGLAQRGWSDGDIRKIIGGNVMRVARQALEGSSHDSPSF
jgi:membrane dipeptidase